VEKERLGPAHKIGFTEKKNLQAGKINTGFYACFSGKIGFLNRPFHGWGSKSVTM
jgi:hypothetical protein